MCIKNVAICVINLSRLLRLSKYGVAKTASASIMNQRVEPMNEIQEQSFWKWWSEVEHYQHLYSMRMAFDAGFEAAMKWLEHVAKSKA